MQHVATACAISAIEFGLIMFGTLPLPPPSFAPPPTAPRMWLCSGNPVTIDALLPTPPP
jgi:hypothetical protein